jgi:ABC-type lipoprotein release transport system permease subunit
VKATDPAVFLLVPILLGGMAIVASIGPAMKAARTDPATALR